MRYGLIASLVLGAFALFAPLSLLAQDFTPRCDGVDLRSTLEAAEVASIKEEVTAIPNGKGRFWKIEKPGTAPSWLLGTMHVVDDRVRQLSDAEQAAFENADRLALELNLDNLTQSSQVLFGKTLVEHPEIFSYAQDNIVKNSIPAPQFSLFEEVLKKRKLSYKLLSRTKPWLIWAMFSASPCLIAETYMDRAVFDMQLGLEAQSRRKPVIGLENIDEQLKAFDSLPLNFYVTSIIQLGFLFDKLNHYHETMIGLYLDGEIGAIMPTLQALMVRDLEQAGLGDAEIPSPADMLSFETILLDKRNAIMASRAAPLLDEGNSFIAVGALHLVGETGLVEQFRRLGYQVTRAE